MGPGTRRTRQQDAGLATACLVPRYHARVSAGPRYPQLTRDLITGGKGMLTSTYMVIHVLAWAIRLLENYMAIGISLYAVVMYLHRAC